MGTKIFVFDCQGRDVPPIMVIHATCLEIAIREARHRFEKTWPSGEFPDARIDLSSVRKEPDRGYFSY